MSDRALLDANLLVYAMAPNAPQHAVALRVCNDALAGSVDACVAAQVLFEFFATVTNPKRVTTPRTPAVAWSEVEKFRSALPVLPVPPDVVERTAALAQSLGTAAQEVFDVQLAATMLANGVERIYTFDHGVFGRVPGIRIVEP
ncbi:MAG: TA system VapC family ribonuclease toxin [Myxococcota bacterium]